MEILIVAGDPSGDLHASHLIKALRKHGPEGLRVTAVGGPLMKAQADAFLEDLASRGVTGFWEPFVKLPFMIKLLLRLKKFMQERKPAALICVDYYGFNRRVLSVAKTLGVPAYYYVSPQVWASRPGRIQTLKRLVRKMLVIFPFEAKVYQKAGVPCDFVGHPLLDFMPKPVEKSAPGKPLQVGLLPGSRRSEIKKHLPVLLAAAVRLRERWPNLELYVFAAASLPDSAYRHRRSDKVTIVRDPLYAKRRELDIALCSSGTATLENALLGVPMVVIYKLSWLTYRIAKAIVRVKFIAMANILANKSLAPELIQDDATPHQVAEAAKAILQEPGRYAELREQLLALRGLLGSAGAAERAARLILSDVRAAEPALKK